MIKTKTNKNKKLQAGTLAQISTKRLLPICSKIAKNNAAKFWVQGGQLTHQSGIEPHGRYRYRFRPLFLSLIRALSRMGSYRGRGGCSVIQTGEAGFDEPFSPDLFQNTPCDKIGHHHPVGLYAIEAVCYRSRFLTRSHKPRF